MTETHAQPEQQKQVLRMHLRAAFLTTEAGRYAGRWLLNHLKLLGRLENDADRTLHNAAVEFLAAGEFKLTEFLEGAQDDGR